jgi:hypothetical protein
MDYEAYKNAVMDKVEELYDQKFESFCTDTIRTSWQDKLSIDAAVEKVYDDTSYWAGDWSCPK